MIRIEAKTLEEAYQNAASSLECSVTELKVEVVQSPTNGILGFFKKDAIIIATKEVHLDSSNKDKKVTEQNQSKAFGLKDTPSKEFKSKPITKKEKKVELKKEKVEEIKEEKLQEKKTAVKTKKQKATKEKDTHTILNDTIMPASFVNMQDEDDEIEDNSTYLADYDDEEDEIVDNSMINIASTIKKDINELFDFTCFNIDEIDVKVYDENTLLIEFKGDDAALLIGKEGYRYKALSYMIFNWINSKYQVQLRLEIAEFLKNQEESVSRYLETVYENVDRDGRAQTKILDGVLVQIALKELRNRYHDKYVAIRSTRDGMKYIIINDYHSN